MEGGGEWVKMKVSSEGIRMAATRLSRRYLQTYEMKIYESYKAGSQSTAAPEVVVGNGLPVTNRGGGGGGGGGGGKKKIKCIGKPKK